MQAIRKTVHVGNAEIIYRKGDKCIQSITKHIKNTDRKNAQFFKMHPKPYKIRLVYTNAEYDKIAKFRIKTSRLGTIRNNTIIMFSPSIRKQYFSLESFFMHEINHIYYINIVGSYHPVWFSEGMATNFMKTYKINSRAWKKYFRSMKNPQQLLYYRYMKKKYYSKDIHNFYVLSYLIYRHLAKQGEPKIIGMLKRYSKQPNKENFEIQFQKTFHKPIIKILQEAIQ